MALKRWYELQLDRTPRSRDQRSRECLVVRTHRGDTLVLYAVAAHENHRWAIVGLVDNIDKPAFYACHYGHDVPRAFTILEPQTIRIMDMHVAIEREDILTLGLPRDWEIVDITTTQELLPCT